jgi:hypothetical protein
VAVYIRSEHDLEKLEQYLKDNRHEHVHNNVDLHLLYSDSQVCIYIVVFVQYILLLL